MYHTIEIRVTWVAEMTVPGATRPTQVLIQRGSRCQAQVRPHVMDSDWGPIEVADLLMDDGSITYAVPFAFFRFVDDWELG